MKEYLTMKEASLLIGKTPKTIKNYIKKGVIKNFFLVDGKYGQEYQISVRDLEPLGIAFLDVLQDDYDHHRKLAVEDATLPGEYITGAGENIRSTPGGHVNRFDTRAFIFRHEELTLELSKAREKLAMMTEENSRLKQELEEKNMLIQVLMKKGDNP